MINKMFPLPKVRAFSQQNPPINLTVHIGTTKTGSSSIQKFLDLNREELRHDGIMVPMCLGQFIHLKSVIAALPYRESPDLAKSVQISGRWSHIKFRRNVRAQFRKEVAAAPACAKALISAEHLHSRLAKARHVRNFQKLFCRDFAHVRIVIYVRPQLDHIVSLYSTMLRGGYKLPLEDFIVKRMQPRYRHYFDLKKLILRWGNVFGHENIIVRPYKSVNHNAGTLGDFCGIMGIDLAGGGWRMPVRANTSINFEGQQMLLALNRNGNLTPDQRRDIVKWAEVHHAGHGAMPPLALAQSFQSLFLEENAWVTQNYFPNHPEYLQPRWPED